MNFLATLSPSPSLSLNLGSLLVVVVAEEGQMTLGTLVGEMPSVPALETSYFIQSLESTRVSVCPAHRMHPEKNFNQINPLQG